MQAASLKFSFHSCAEETKLISSLLLFKLKAPLPPIFGQFNSDQRMFLLLHEAVSLKPVLQVTWRGCAVMLSPLRAPVVSTD